MSIDKSIDIVYNIYNNSGCYYIYYIKLARIYWYNIIGTGRDSKFELYKICICDN